jgi:hypothetical protein
MCQSYDVGFANEVCTQNALIGIYVLSMAMELKETIKNRKMKAK